MAGARSAKSVADRSAGRARKRGNSFRGSTAAVLAAAIACAAAGAAARASTGSATAAASAATAARLRTEALADDGALKVLESLTTEVGSRFSGTPGDLAAIAWAEAKARELGLPKVWTEPVTVPRWTRGEAKGAIVAPWPQPVALLALGGSVGTPPEGVEAEVVRVESLESLDALTDEQIRGRIVFFDQRMRPSSDGGGYGETVPIRGKGPAAAGKRGAAAVLIRSVATDSNRLPHTGATRYEEGVPKIPAAALSVPDADLLARQLASQQAIGKAVRFRLTLGARFDGEASSANVLAEIPGREHPEEIVLLVAHHDSWDVGTGAQDNGTGVALLLDIGKRLANEAGSNPPRRTLRLLLTANEEFGLSGARAYAEAHRAELANHVLAMELDSGAGRAVSVATRFAEHDPDAIAAADELAQLLAPLGVAAVATPASGGADLSPIAPTGVPLVDLDQDRTHYFDIHHTENDTFDKVDPASLRQLQAAAVTVAHWATHRDQPLAHAAATPPPSP